MVAAAALKAFSRWFQANTDSNTATSVGGSRRPISASMMQNVQRLLQSKLRATISVSSPVSPSLRIISKEELSWSSAESSKAPAVGAALEDTVEPRLPNTRLGLTERYAVVNPYIPEQMAQLLATLPDEVESRPGQMGRQKALQRCCGDS